MAVDGGDAADGGCERWVFSPAVRDASGHRALAASSMRSRFRFANVVRIPPHR
jgi:hypothetical protein